MPASQDMLDAGHENIRARELPGLTPLRGLAALVVVFYHASFLAANYGGGAPPIIWRRGYLAVDLFFFLSGFVLTHVYRSRLAPNPSWRTVGGFLWARFCRIYPAALFVTVVHLLIHLFGWPFPAQASLKNQLVAALALMQVPWLKTIELNAPAWSISAELYAYLLFPFIAPIIGRLSSRVALVFAATLLTGIAVDHAIFTHGQQDWGWGALIRTLPEFTAGIFAYRAYREQQFREFWRSDAVLLAVAATIVAALVADVSDGVLVILLPALLLAAVSNSGHAALVLNVRPLHWLGEISYSLYIFQRIPLLLVIAAAPALVAHGIRGVWVESLAVGLAVTGGVLVHRRIDVPARAALRRLPTRLAAIAAARRRARPGVIPAMLDGD